MKRRTFLSRVAQAAVITTPAASQILFRDSQPDFLTNREESVLEAVLDVYFPAGSDAPSARDIRAKEYLLTIISDPDIETSERERLERGLRELDRFSHKTRDLGFVELQPTVREKVLRAFIDEADGEGWAANVMSYALEAMFGDPAYGVNTNEVGWKWIDHHAGFPHPTQRKWYRGL